MWHLRYLRRPNCTTQKSHADNKCTRSFVCAQSFAHLPRNAQNKTWIRHKMERGAKRHLWSIYIMPTTSNQALPGRDLHNPKLCPTTGDAVVHGVFEMAQARRTRSPLLRHRPLQAGLAATNRRHHSAIGRTENVDLFHAHARVCMVDMPLVRTERTRILCKKRVEVFQANLQIVPGGRVLGYSVILLQMQLKVSSGRFLLPIPSPTRTFPFTPSYRSVTPLCSQIRVVNTPRCIHFSTTATDPLLLENKLARRIPHPSSPLSAGGVRA